MVPWTLARPTRRKQNGIQPSAGVAPSWGALLHWRAVMPSLRAVLAAAPLLLSLGCTTAQIHEKALVNNELCVQQLQGGDVRQAEIYCDLGLEYSPNYADLWFNKGLIALARGDESAAKENFIKALRLNNDHAAAHMNLGRVYLNAGLPLAAAFEAALADYQSFGVPAECEG